MLIGSTSRSQSNSDRHRRVRVTTMANPMPLSVPFMFFGICFGLWTALGVSAQQFVPASCNASLGFQWADNSLGQDPCQIATFLGQVCDSNYRIPAINSSESYFGPTPAQNNSCLCSSVEYILLSACGACQGGTYRTWTGYNQNCSTVYPMM
ncbi:hypothetical protein GYMLUDRAFT_45827 [Collybiopsis luxurians FD-317 M1]|uniref:Uncharacterized protein n=1 Tax=Collybiopsis luxurians FD-317 M1 TaxID=944289 RepID=A0A0D0BR23_9AGAR|nr:hypothetical protein GYMLUDRAFT_45827 [Collybiopsis luxurians FD-317 M1]